MPRARAKRPYVHLHTTIPVEVINPYKDLAHALRVPLSAVLVAILEPIGPYIREIARVAYEVRSSGGAISPEVSARIISIMASGLSEGHKLLADEVRRLGGAKDVQKTEVE